MLNKSLLGVLLLSASFQDAESKPLRQPHRPHFGTTREAATTKPAFSTTIEPEMQHFDTSLEADFVATTQEPDIEQAKADFLRRIRAARSFGFSDITHIVESAEHTLSDPLTDLHTINQMSGHGNNPITPIIKTAQDLAKQAAENAGKSVEETPDAVIDGDIPIPAEGRRRFLNEFVSDRLSNRNMVGVIEHPTDFKKSDEWKQMMNRGWFDDAVNTVKDKVVDPTGDALVKVGEAVAEGAVMVYGPNGVIGAPVKSAAESVTNRSQAPWSSDARLDAILAAIKDGSLTLPDMNQPEADADSLRFWEISRRNVEPAVPETTSFQRTQQLGGHPDAPHGTNPDIPTAALRGFWDALEDAVDTVNDKVVQPVKEKVDNSKVGVAVNALADTATNRFAWLDDIVDTVGDAVDDFVSDFVDDFISDPVGSIKDAIKDGSVSVFDAINSNEISVEDALSEGLLSVLEAVDNGLDVIEAINDNLLSVTDAVHDGFLFGDIDVIEGIIDGNLDIFDAVKDNLISVQDAINDHLISAVNAVKEELLSVADAIDGEYVTALELVIAGDLSITDALIQNYLSTEQIVNNWSLIQQSLF